MKALFVIDMQEDYVGSKNRYGYHSADLVGKVNKRIAQAKTNQEMIIYIKNKRVLKNGVSVPEFVEGLQVLSPYIFYKEKSSLFSNPEILERMKESGVTEVEIIGVDGNCCVASSALDAVKAGYTVVFPCEFIGARNKERLIKKLGLLRDAGVIIIE